MSLRTRLTISYVSFFAVALIILHIGLYFLVQQALFNSVDNELRLGSQLLQQDFYTSNETLQSYYGTRKLFAPPSISDFGGTNLLVQVYQGDGTVVARSSNMPANIGDQLGIDDTVFDQVMNGGEMTRSSLRGSGQVREWLAPLNFRGRNVGVIQVVRPLREINEALRLLTYALVGGGVIVLLAAARGGTWLTRAAFKPINEIAETAQSIVSAEDLSRRVPVPAAEDELQRLTVTINDLLARLEHLFNAQRRFMADVSHELRTPLAAMSGNLDVLERGAARDPQLLAESLADMRSEVSRLIRMVNDLLLLAQSESGMQLRHEPVELDTLVLEVHRELRPLAGGVHLRLGHEDQIVVQGDRDRIKQALLNLAANALQHTPSGGSVTISLAERDGFAVISVADTGSGIASEDLPYIFDRFYRADRARTHVRGGAGLGLSIVKWIVDVHGGYVEAASTLGAGSSFTLYLPLEAPNIVLSDTTEQKILAEAR